jgi:radical SAM superfamily enzyme YgiQ (UPF0313 family)
MTLKGKNKEIVLIQTGAYRVQAGGALLHLPFQHMSLAAWLRQDEEFRDSIRIADMCVHRLDLSFFENCGIVGVSAMTGLQIRYGLQAASLARRANPNVVIVWGGIHPSLLPEQTVQNELVDVVVIGEGEETFRELVHVVYQGKDIANIPGTCIRKSNGKIVLAPQRPLIDFGKMPLPAYDLVNIHDYTGIEYQFDYQSSRGCPFNCGFCYNTAFSGSTWRSKKAELVVDELEYLYDRYKVKNFALLDDESFINTKRIEAIFRGIIERKIECGVVTSCRLDIVRKLPSSSLSVIKKGGVVQLFFGAESGSNETLRNINKKITKEDITAGALKVAESGIRPILSFMGGFPGETLDQFDETFDIIQKLWQLHPLISVNGIFPFNAYPGTELFLKAKEMGLNPPETLEEWGNWSFQYKPDNPWLDERMKKLIQLAFYIVRFRYYLVRFEDRHHNDFRVRLLKVLVFPLTLSAKIRFSRRWFRFAWEWHLFAFLARKTFGYL